MADSKVTTTQTDSKVKEVKEEKDVNKDEPQGVKAEDKPKPTPPKEHESVTAHKVAITAGRLGMSDGQVSQVLSTFLTVSEEYDGS